LIIEVKHVFENIAPDTYFACFDFLYWRGGKNINVAASRALNSP
jgi:hypothetical protein